ncbi:P-loop containing nucleoside triphosphate hydrolase protein [Daedalea quercina L-15889]|uniref:p-loop containing nucleoside triphosphate hydrolase protein n=1 Tax=Daedalea quercina L-15889 TaxID=1314783 RepID=A0A165TWX8_9APHY|nr:P-loop containing nucleoside triphosphate hydrolase protein [Daedalea quercina L-15889]
MVIRGRSAKASVPTAVRAKANPHASDFGAPPFKKPPGASSSHLSSSPLGPPPSPTHAGIESYLGKHVKIWAKGKVVADRLESFGLERSDIQPMLTRFVTAIKEISVLPALAYDEENLQRMADDFALPPTEKPKVVERWLTRLLFEWGHSAAGQAALGEVVSPLTLVKISELFQAADLSKPEAMFPITRIAPPRKIIMHVGPTNSGKTHHALRALAAARTGVYAGPLRLLAHEIWERLNKGQIIPAGVDVGKEEVEEDPAINFDVGLQPVIRKSADGRYVRPCNMITGEEQKIVDEHATLTSCTVEMVSVSQRYDVAVIDEIQLLGDPGRGGAWLRALLGLNAAEVHLCGEETAVPLVRSLLRATGDEVIVNHYKRLTPLQVENKSLNGDLSMIRKGDCIVVFSRKQLFVLKKRIEKSSGMQCAVAYGRLPPEIRSEQAALFNSPDSGYDVLVGTDAIGMGLNLKIKRVILYGTKKFDGIREVTLSTSQIKQIAGRAGRYGLHGDDSAGGFTTTLQQPDLPVLRKALAEPVQNLKEARISLFGPSYHAVATILPPNTGVLTVAEVLLYVSKLHPQCELEDTRKLQKRVEVLDAMQPALTISDQMTLQTAPAPVTDDSVLQALGVITRLYCENLRVGLQEAMREADLLEDHTVAVRMIMQGRGAEDEYQQALQTLETVHWVIVMYLWLSYRLPVAFVDQEEAFKLRDITERAMQKCLDLLTAIKGESTRHASSRPRKGGIQYRTKTEIKDEVSRRRTQTREHAKAQLERLQSVGVTTKEHARQ